MEKPEYYQTILGCMNEQVYVRDRHMNIQYINPAAEKLTGWTLKECLGKKCYEVFGDEHLSCRNVCPAEKAITEHLNVLHHEGELKTRDGDHRKMRASISCFRRNDQVAGAVVVMRDITDLKDLEDALAKSEYNLNLAQSVAGVGSWHMDIANNLLTWSDETYRMFGVRKGTPLNSAAFLKYVHPEDLPAVESAWQSALRGAPYDLAHRIISGGRERWVHEKARVVFDANAKPMEAVGTVLDITEHHLAREALAEERNMFVSGPAMVFKWRAEPGWPVVYASENVQQLLGYSPGELIAGEPSYVELIHYDDLARVSEEVDRHKQAGVDRFEHQPYRLKCRDGRHLWVSDHTMFLRDHAGKATHCQGYVVDISRQHESEERLALAIQGTQAGLWDWFVQSEKVVFNEHWAKIVGYSLAELEPVGIQTWMDLCHPDDLKKSNELLQEHLAGETDYYKFEARMKHKNGSWVWVLDRGKVTEWDSDGKPVRITGTHVDVTERKRIDALLRAESGMAKAWSMATTFQERLKACLGIAIETTLMDCGGIYLVNETDPGFSLAVHQGLSEAFVNRAGRFSEDSENSRMVRKGKPIYSMHQNLGVHLQDARRREGLKAIGLIPIWFEDRIIACMNVASHTQTHVPEYTRTALERIAQFSGSFIGQEVIEEQYRKERRDMNTLFDTLDDMLFILDMEGRIIHCNRRVCTLLEYARNELFGKHVLTLHPEERRREAQNVITAMLNGESTTCPVPLLSKNGDWIPVETKVTQGRWKGSDVLFGISRDITERIEMDRKKQQIEKAESLSRMAGAVAHLFNNQLAVVMGNLELVQEDLSPNADVSNNLGEAMRAARRASETSGLMLTLLGQSPGRPEPMDLARVCRKQLDGLRAGRPESAPITVDLPKSGPVIHADPAQMKQVVDALVANAMEALDGKGEVRVKVYSVAVGDIPEMNRRPLDWTPSKERYACLVVTDTGCGMDRDTVNNIFDPFFTDKFTGRGLGLPVSQGIINALGGCITVESVPGKGSAFRVFLPQSSETVSTPKAAGHETEQTPAQGGTVLLVDDQEMVFNVASAMLKRLGFDVISARDGKEAVEIFRQRADDIRLVLTDLTMPFLNGWETLAAVRGIRPDIPVILSSGYDQASAMAENPVELPQVFLSKPYQMETLKQAVARALNG